MTIEEAISLSFAAVLALCLILWGILVCYNRKLKTALNQRDYFRELRDHFQHGYANAIRILLSDESRDWKVVCISKKGQSMFTVIDYSHRPWILAKSFPYIGNDPDDREFAYNCAVELCDKLNEK